MDKQHIKYLNKNGYIRELSEAVKKCCSMFGLTIEGDFGQVINDLADLIMELNPKATLEDIKRAFRNAAKGMYGVHYKLTTVVLYHFVREYFGTQTQRVNVHNYEEEEHVERNPLQDRKNFMRHMYDFHINDRTIYGGWHYVYETMLLHGWISDNELASEMDEAYKVLEERLKMEKFNKPELRHSIDREIAQLADLNNGTLRSKAMEMACRRQFDEWRSSGITPDDIYVQITKISTSERF